MSDDVQVVEPLKVTIAYGKKITYEGGYGANDEVTIHYQVDTQGAVTPEEIDERVKDAFFRVKALAFEQLGVEFAVDPHDPSILRSTGEDIRLPRRATPPARATKAAADAEAAVEEAFDGDGAWSLTVKGTQYGPLPEWLFEQAREKGVHEVWDNRGGENPATKANRKPFFKEVLPKGSSADAVAFWPPR